MLGYNEISVEDRLQFYIRKFWMLDNWQSPLHTTTMYALPNTCFTLVFIIGNGIVLGYPDKTATLSSGSYLVGQLTTQVAVTLLPYTKAFMVQLNSWAASLLSKLSFHELTNRSIRLVDVNKAFSHSLVFGEFSDLRSFKNTIEKAFDDYVYPTESSRLIASCFNHFKQQPIGNRVRVTELSAHTQGIPQEAWRKSLNKMLGFLQSNI